MGVMKMGGGVINIDVKEFRSKGYLQELNRRFLHPLGLALEVIINENNGDEVLGGIWDYRNDPEGIHYDLKNSDMDRINAFKNKKMFIDSEFEKKKLVREKMFGNIIEPIE